MLVNTMLLISSALVSSSGCGQERWSGPNMAPALLGAQNPEAKANPLHQERKGPAATQPLRKGCLLSRKGH